MATSPGRKTKRPVGSVKPRARTKPSPVPTRTSAAPVLVALAGLGSASAAAVAQRFFKTGAGQYAAGDVFLGIRVPVLRAFARDLKDAGLDIAWPLLKSAWHEARSLALMLLVRAYQRGDGWMLREVGKRVSQREEESFLKRYYREMPRTMLRYAIERFAEPARERYLRGLV